MVSVPATQHFMACQRATKLPPFIMQAQSNTSFLTEVRLQEPVADYLVFTFQRDFGGKDFFHILALRQNLEEFGRDALIEAISDFYFEQPGESARITRNTVVSVLVECLQMPNHFK